MTNAFNNLTFILALFTKSLMCFIKRLDLLRYTCKSNHFILELDIFYESVIVIYLLKL